MNVCDIEQNWNGGGGICVKRNRESLLVKKNEGVYGVVEKNVAYSFLKYRNEGLVNYTFLSSYERK